MTSRFFLSLTAFSLVFSYPTYAEESATDDAFVEQVFEEAVADKTGEQQQAAVNAIAVPQKEEKQPSSKKKKPHFAGIRRAPDSKPKTASPQKKSRKVKNQWFSSKTQPKNDKKGAAENEEDSPELPDDRPYFKRVSNVITPPLVAQATPTQNCSTQTPAHFSVDAEGYEYPRTGFQAPRGHIYATAEWLFWRTRQEGMEFVTAKQLEFDFHSGFRVGIGAHLPSFDGWNIYVNYTNFSPERSHSQRGPAYPLFLFQGTGISGTVIAEAHGHWHIGFQSVDVEFGKSYYLTKTLVFSPFFGLKGAWIDQHAKFRYEGGYIPAGQTFRTHFKNDFKGAGPLLGTEINWQLGWGFSFFGDIATALAVGHFDNEQKQDQLGGLEAVDLDSDFNLVSPVLQMVTGLAWDRNFNRDRWHAGLSAGFETQYWWSQNQTEQFTADTRPTYIRQRGDLAFYGLTLRGRFDF